MCRRRTRAHARFPDGNRSRRRDRDWELGVSLVVLLDWRAFGRAIILLSHLIIAQIAKASISLAELQQSLVVLALSPHVHPSIVSTLYLVPKSDVLPPMTVPDGSLAGRGRQ